MTRNDFPNSGAFLNEITFRAIDRLAAYRPDVMAILKASSRGPAFAVRSYARNQVTFQPEATLEALVYRTAASVARFLVDADKEAPTPAHFCEDDGDGRCGTCEPLAEL